MSRKNTARAPMKRPMPMEKSMTSTRPTTNHRTWIVGITPSKTMTMATAMRLKAKLTAAEKTFWTGKTQRSTLTFFRRDEASMIERRPPLVASFMRAKVMLPTMR